MSALGRVLARSIGEITGEAARFEMRPGLLETRFYGRVGLTGAFWNLKGS
jgi:hypothetical protein